MVGYFKLPASGGHCHELTEKPSNGLVLHSFRAGGAGENSFRRYRNNIVSKFESGEIKPNQAKNSQPDLEINTFAIIR
jgi:hypothetical protein